MVASYYKPDGGPAAPLYAMLCEGLVARGHHVIVITAVPHYPSGKVPTRYKRKWLDRKVEKGVEVFRVGLPSVDRTKLYWRLLQFVYFQVAATWVGRRIAYDVMLAHSPALESWLPVAYHTKFQKKPIIYSVHDVYPNVGVQLGIFKYAWIIKIVAGMEKYCLDKAALVRVLSKSFIPGVSALGIPESKIRLIYDWVETDVIKPLLGENRFLVESKLDGYFVVMYAGNMGLVQGLENVLKAAELLLDYSDIRFVFVGDGASRKSLEATSKKIGLSNVDFFPYQPREKMTEIFASANVSLVSLIQGTGLGALPSKIYSILASGKPLIAIIDPDSETREVVQTSQSGICVNPDSPQELAQAILRLRNDPILSQNLGENGRRYVVNHHSPSFAAEEFEKMFLEVV